MDKKLSNLLVRSFDAELTSDEQIELKKGLKESKELRSEQLKYIELRKMLQQKTNSFADDFSTRVMGQIKEERFSSTLFSLYKQIVYAGAASIAILVGMHLYSGGSFTIDSLLGIESVSKDILTFNVFGH